MRDALPAYDLLAWLRDAGPAPAVAWAEGDLAVVAAARA
jgi:hypothetical protein